MTETIKTPVELSSDVTTGLTITRTIDVVVGDWIVVWAGYNNVSGEAMAVSDAVDTYTQANTEVDVTNSQDFWEVWYTKATTTGTRTITITYSPDPMQYRGVLAFAVSGLSAAAFVNAQHNTQNAPGTGVGAITSGAGVNSGAGENLVIGFGLSSGSGAPNTTSGWTNLGTFLSYDNTTGSGTPDYLRAVYKHVSGVASQIATFTAQSGQGGDPYSAFVLILDVTASSASPIPGIRGMSAGMIGMSGNMRG